MTDVSNSLRVHGAGAISHVQWIIIVAISLLCTCAWFGNTVYRSLAEPDEGRYAEIPREMLVSGDWITPTLNAVPYLEKPPLQYWATAIGYSIFGLQPWVSRVYAATLGLLGIAVTYATGRLLWGARAGEFAALIQASCPLYFVVAHINTLDIGLAFYLNAALACLLKSQQVGGNAPSQRRWMWLCWLLLAAGFLQKGLVSIVLPAVTVGSYCLACRDWRLLRQLHVRDGMAILAVVTLPWMILVSMRNPEFAQFFFVHEHFARFATTVHRRAEPWWFFIAILCVGTLPWLNMVVQAVARKRRLERRERMRAGMHAEAFLLVWTLTLLVFFSLSGSKLAPYIVPAVMPLALLTGRWLQQHAKASVMWPAVAVGGLLFLSLLLARPLIEHLLQPGIKQTAYVEVSAWALTAGLVGMAGVAIAIHAIRKDDLRLAVGAVAGSVAIALAVLMCGSNSLQALRSRPGLAGLIAPHLGANTAFYCVGMYWQTLPFALQRTCTLVEHQGELERQFDRPPLHWLPSLAEFVARWNGPGSAVAVVSPAMWSQLQPAGLSARVLVDEPGVVVIVRP